MHYQKKLQIFMVQEEGFMETLDVIGVRIYITEASRLLNKFFYYLKEVVEVRGASVFRAIKGFGETGEQTCSIVDLSWNLPLVIEFFDQKR